MNSEPTETNHRTEQTNASGGKPSAREAGRSFGVVLGPSLVLDLFAVLGTLAVGSGRVFRSREGLARLLRPLAIVGALLPWVYAFFIRPWHLRWGATEEEITKPLPGDELVPHPAIESTRATTVAAPVEEVWPWIAQLGQGRGGLYSYDFLGNLAGLDIHSADRIVTELQNLKVGDLVRLAPEQFGPEAGFRVVGVDPVRVLLLHQPTDPDTKRPMDRDAPNLGSYFGWNWAFVLGGRDRHATRLIIRSRVDGKPRPLIRLLFTPLVEIPHFVMERWMLKGIKERAERERADAQKAQPS